MGRLARDAKNLILGNDGSDKEPSDFKTELQNAIKSGLISKADGTLLITSRANNDKLGELIYKAEEKEVIKSERENKKEFNDEIENKKKKEEKRKEKERQDKIQSASLEQQIEASKNATRAKIEAEKNLGKTTNDKERKE